MALKHTPEEVKEQIKGIKEFTDDKLVHYTKIISSKQLKAEKTLYEPLRKAIEKERRARGTITTISKIVQTSTKKTEGGADGDDY